MSSVSSRVHVIAGVGLPCASQKNAEFPPASVVLFCGRLKIFAGSGWKMEKCFRRIISVEWFLSLCCFLTLPQGRTQYVLYRITHVLGGRTEYVLSYRVCIRNHAHKKT